ncbi:uncharacterized protein LOC123508628 [Portunus trituberculatus]|uniref:uncharacterized protein LOC123508628 n=1 Tax=Portunus trituberculatus TaxID=210409 RepID=UPI001E1CCA97|nr:uncharacterized protein LOC123508628 [Portunus trituberculatus]
MTEKVIGCVSLIFLLADNSLTLACCAIHFIRGSLYNGTVNGAISVVLFCVAGIITNLFHFFRHEATRMPQRSAGKKAKTFLLICIPNYYLVMWSLMRCVKSESLTIKCWTASLRLFYCSTGSLVQAVYQSYLVVRLWWEDDIPNEYYIIMIVTAVYLTLYAIYGVCRYVWVQCYDETGSYLPLMHIFLITFTLTLNMCGRVTAMSVVMGTLGWWWLVIAIATPFLVNFAVYIHTAAQRTPEKIGYFHNCCRYISLIPLALLSSMTISDKRYLTILTTLAWIASYLPQILMFNSHMTNWLVWIVPTVAQICSLIIMMATWKVFEAAFYRFSRLAGTHPWSVTFLRVECTQNVIAQPTHSIMQ